MTQKRWLKILCFIALGQSPSALAGYWEISANGSYFKRYNGQIAGDHSYTTTQRIGAGIAYSFIDSTSVELNYTNSLSVDLFNQEFSSLTNPLRTERRSQFDNLSLSLVLQFAPKGAAFRPFVRGGGGYMVRNTRISGTTLDPVSNTDVSIDLGGASTERSASAEGGIGFKIYVSNSTAVEISYIVYATELDQPQIFLHYALSGGLRFIF